MSSLSFTADAYRARPALRLASGVLLCAAIAAAAYLAQAIEVQLTGHAWLEALVLAILIGAGVRAVWSPSRRFCPGVAFSAKVVLEIAVVLLGATVSGAAILGVGPKLLLGVPVLVGLAIAASYGLGRALRLPHKMALLVACGNAICGNSAIAAVAPVIDAEGDDVGCAIAFTAVLGVVVVLGLPLAGLAAGMSPHSFGVLAGLTVYAVPQVLAAAAPVSQLSVQVGAVVKLVRVLMLGPVVLVLSLLNPAARTAVRRPPLHQLVPWFIVAFLALVAVRSLGWMPEALVQPAAAAANILTVVAMAALGLSVDLPAMAKVGPRVAATVTASLAILAMLALALIRLAGVA
jgi:uncharacterized integral membrane protein (TIGR00698 family)